MRRQLLSQENIMAMLAQVGAVIADSHIVYTSGKHGSAYVNKDAIYPDTSLISRLCETLAMAFVRERVEVVVAPALGGIVLTQWVAHHLSELTLSTPLAEDTLAVYAEKTADGNFVLARGYDKLVAGKRVLVLEDVLNTGGSAKKVVELVRATGGKVIGLGALCNRGGVTSRDVGDVPKLISLVNVTLDAWDEGDCPLCAQGVPINTTVGKGKDFLERKRQAQGSPITAE